MGTLRAFDTASFALSRRTFARWHHGQAMSVQMEMVMVAAMTESLFSFFWVRVTDCAVCITSPTPD